MEKIKILHCADLHLGSELSQVQSKGQERKQELLRTFRRITAICRDEKIDLLLIAGDLFEGSDIDPSTVQSVKTYLRELNTTITAIAPGNHDYISIDSPYSDDDWPDQVIIFNDKPQKITFPDRGFALYGAGFTSTYKERPMLADFPPADPGLINICVLHGDLISEGGRSSYNPISESMLAATGYEYIALGHIHKRSPVSRAGRSFYAYPGCPDGRGFDELGEKGVYIGTIDRQNSDLRFYNICSRMFLTAEVDITDIMIETEIVRKIIGRLNELYGESYDSHYYKIILGGKIAADYTLPLQTIQDSLNERLHYAKVRDNTRIAANLEALAAETSLKGIFVSKMLEKTNEQPAAEDSAALEQLTKALEFGLRAFEGEVTLNDY
jgi:DNA repair exonuclease SbcCD nuclease subunit